MSFQHHCIITTLGPEHLAVNIFCINKLRLSGAARMRLFTAALLVSTALALIPSMREKTQPAGGLPNDIESRSMEPNNTTSGHAKSMNGGVLRREDWWKGSMDPREMPIHVKKGQWFTDLMLGNTFDVDGMLEKRFNAPDPKGHGSQRSELDRSGLRASLESDWKFESYKDQDVERIHMWTPIHAALGRLFVPDGADGKQRQGDPEMRPWGANLGFELTLSKPGHQPARSSHEAAATVW